MQFTRFDNPYRFQGLRLDAATGLHHARFRDYADWLGRWTQQDPAGWPDGVNRYSSLHLSPLRIVDPTGLAGKDIEQIDRIVKMSGLNKDGRRKLHESLRHLKGPDGLAPEDIIIELAQELAEQKKYRVPRGFINPRANVYVAVVGIAVWTGIAYRNAESEEAKADKYYGNNNHQAGLGYLDYWFGVVGLD